MTLIFLCIPAWMTIFISGAISGAGTFGAPDYNIGFNGFSIVIFLLAIVLSVL
jgi:hypothetical protein